MYKQSSKMETSQTKVSGNKLMRVLDCSKPYLYDLIGKGIITPYYFEGNFTKPYFDLKQVFSALKPQPNGGIKRKSYVRKNITHEPA